jgi:hypothetical protein
MISAITINYKEVCQYAKVQNVANLIMFVKFGNSSNCV